MPFEIMNIFYSVLTTTISTLLIIFLQNFFVKKTHKKENKEIEDEVAITFGKIKDSTNVIELMINNVAELKEYYVISKQQANKSFSSALLICFLGFTVFISGIAVNYFGNQNVVVYTTIAGSIVEIISGLFFWLYKNSIKQLNIYHQRLGTTEKYLTAMQLIEKMSKDTRDDNYQILMQSILRDNSVIVKQDSENKHDKLNT